ncbi:hypothetical protein [Methylocapsa acidiphila]|uniref:hypothetical protein n=1 Tax=Methylocapsa acidiphila TaxID=133552 RepID=UPI0003FA8353|nr:hypothetical protein [Methylocapsa acidiphila]
MSEGVFIVLLDPVPKKEAAFHEWFAEFFDHVLGLPGMRSGQKFTFGPNQIDVRPLQQFLAVFELDEVESVRNGAAEKYGVKTSKEILRLPDCVDQTTIMPTFFDAVSPIQSAPEAPETPLEQQNLLISLISVGLDKQASFAEAYVGERLGDMLSIPAQISGRLLQVSKHQIQNPIYPFVAIYRNNDSQQILSAWPAPGTNWRSIAAARARDPSIRADGRLASMKTRDFLFEPYVAPEAAKPAA